MDNMNYNPYESTSGSYGYRPYKPANKFETASQTLGVASIALCSIIYLSFPFGALSIIFAFLSRGAKMEFGPKAKLGLILGIIGLAVTIILYAYTIYTLLQDPASLEALLREACESAGYDYEALFQDMLSN